jgi:galactose mutarotase-like enzyme
VSREPDDVVLADEHWCVTVAPTRGMLIRDAIDVPSGAAALWQKPAPGLGPPSRSLPPPGPASIDTFWDVFAGGWFPMFPAAGFTGELDGAPTLFHGELNRLPWEIVDRAPASVVAHVDTVRAPFSVTRRVALDRGELRIDTAIANVGAAPASYLYGEHPCLWRATFAGGRLRLDARDAWVPTPSFTPDQAVLRPGERFAWPAGPGHAGPLDVSVVPEQPDGRRDHACVALSRGRIGVTAPRFGRELLLELDLIATPYVLLSFAYDDWDMLAVEPLSAPGRGVADAVADGAVRTLAPGERLQTGIAARWQALAPRSLPTDI